MKPAIYPLLILIFLSACAPLPTPVPSATPTDTPTVFRTSRPTITRTPTQTPTPTKSPTVTNTPTPSETPAPLAPANLFTFHDANGRIIDWSYARPSSYEKNEFGTPWLLSGFLAFQLMDRAIHHETISFDAQKLTIYYLNVQHQFNGVQRSPDKTTEYPERRLRKRYSPESYSSRWRIIRTHPCFAFVGYLRSVFISPRCQ